MKTTSPSIYHRVLRVSAVLLAVLLVFESGLLSPLTRDLAQNSHIYVANVIGVGAGVTPTDLNLVTAELTKQRTELEAREAQLTERELNVNLNQPAVAESSDISTYIVSVLLFIILVLLVLNYALDFSREKYLLSLERAS